MFGFAGKILFNAQSVSTADKNSLTHFLPGKNPPATHQWENGFFCNNLFLPLQAPPQVLNYQSQNSHLSITGDIHLYNKNSLFDKLSIVPSQVDGNIDCFLVMKAFEKFGVKCVHHLNGDFSFGIWNHRENSFFAARDQIGVKQFYYNYSHSTLIFANGIREVLKGGRISQEINSKYIVDYLLAIYQNTPQTLFQNIQQLPSGSYLLIDKTQYLIKKYWKPTIRKQPLWSKNRPPSHPLRESLLKSLQARIETTSPIGFLLSGGLDSSSLVCLTRKHLCSNDSAIHIFSKIPEQNSYEGEKEYLDIVLKHTNLQATCCKEELNPDLKYLHEYYKENYTFPVNPFFQIATPLRNRMKHDKIYNIISGLGGDETASDFADNIYAYYLLTGKWNNISQLFRKTKLPPLSLIKNRLILPLLPPFLRKLYCKYKNPNQFNILDYNFINSNSIKPQKIRQKLKKQPGGWKYCTYYDPRKEILATLTNGYMHGPLTLFNCLGRMYSNNVVFPFLDLRVIQSCLTTSPEAYRRNDIPRSFLRDAVTDILPTQILKRRTKSAFANTATSQLTANPDFSNKILQKDNELAWSILNRKDLLAACKKIQKGNYSKQVSEGIAFQVARCLNVAAFLQWLEEEQKKALST
jgi:asparagine synthase (glutamine-hydrolysing)